MLNFLSIARSALYAHQRAMSVTAHNIANAQTPGFTRQRLTLKPAMGISSGGQMVGSGVATSGVTRARDLFFDVTYRREAGLFGSSSTLRDYLQQVESALSEPSDTGIGAALDGLFQAFGDLANDPSSGPHRELVRSAARDLTLRLHDVDNQISRIEADALAQLRADVSDVNRLTTQIADLNAQILSATRLGESVPDLEDQRDLLVDQLAGYVAVRTIVTNDGTVNVQGGNRTLVTGGTATPLEVQLLDGGGYQISVVGHDAPLDPEAGSVGSLLDLLNTRLPDLRSELDSFAEALVTEFNALHSTGYNANGETGINFFDPDHLTAASIRLSDDVLASIGAIATGATDAAGDNEIALAIAGLNEQEVASLGGYTLREFYVQQSSLIGAASKNAIQNTTLHSDLLDQADMLRMSVGGVSVDEEMVNMISQQQAYTAAARLVQIADEVMRELLESF